MKLGAFIVPTGIGASIGGFAGDASYWARQFAKEHKLIVNPNVVNAGCFSGITDNMLYVEGYSLDEFFKGNLKLQESQNNKIGVVFDKKISQGILNVHINTINAVKTIYGIDVIDWDITDDYAGVEFYIDAAGISTGRVNNIQTVVDSAKRLIDKGAEAIAIVCSFGDYECDDYANGIGVDPVGGVEAIISHYISRELKIPCAHSPAFEDIEIEQKIVDARCSAEYITPTYLPCILIGLSQAPKLSNNHGYSIDNLDYLIMPYNSIGSIPIFETVKRNIPVFAVKENKTVLDVTPSKLGLDINIVDSYEEILSILKNVTII